VFCYIFDAFFVVYSVVAFILFLLITPHSFDTFIPKETIMAIPVLEFLVLYPVLLCLWAYRLILFKNDFYFYLAKACVNIVLQSNDTVQKMCYLTLGISYYDKYLQKSLKRRIRDVEEIYSRFLSDSHLDSDKTMELIIEAFGSDDKLKAVACLSSILTDVKKEQFLVK
jgi:ABC-type uncharacterized transport system fused permease/ATPase subunit